MCCCLLSAPAFAADDFSLWLNGVRAEALESGVSPETADHALDGLTTDPRVPALDHRQPEKIVSFVHYRALIVSPERIREGRANLERYGDELDRASRRYGVAPQFIVALWGIESSFGHNMGDFSTVRSLATLAYEGPRQMFFRKELLRALQILDEGDISPEGMTGSWAGAMGQNQFMPSSFLIFAADGDGDGRRDIWHDRADVFASTANYLARSGWRPGERWGEAVHVPQGLKSSYVTLDRRLPLEEWSRLGLTLRKGRPLPDAVGVEASLVAPDGLSGPTYLVYDNYRAIMRWNRSTYFATAVGLLADAIAERN
jgi:membrane-bound lytic murein transglycosylase B